MWGAPHTRCQPIPPPGPTPALTPPPPTRAGLRVPNPWLGLPVRKLLGRPGFVKVMVGVELPLGGCLKGRLMGGAGLEGRVMGGAGL